MDRKQLYNLLVVIILLVSSFSLIVFSPVVKATGNTWYVATTGSDTTGTGTIGNPYLTLRKAINMASNSDTIIMREGDYTEPGWDTHYSIKVNRSGTIAQPFTIRNYTGERVVIDGKLHTISPGYGMIQLYQFNSVYYNNITFYGINFYNCSLDAIKISAITGKPGCANITIDHCNFYNISYRAVYCYNEHAPSPYIRDVRVSNCTFNYIQTNGSSGECVTFMGCKGYVFENNSMSNFYKQGVSAGGSGACYGNIRFNTFYNRFYMAVKFTPYIFGDKSCHHINVYNNLFYGEADSTDSVNNILIGPEEDDNYVHNISIYNNVFNVSAADTKYSHGINIYSVTDTGVRIENISIMYNTIYCRNGIDSACFRVSQGVSKIKDVIFANNIIINGGNTKWQVRFTDLASTQTNVTFFNNVYNKTDGATWKGRFTDGGNISEASAINASPEFSSVSGGDFHLNWSSPCIDAGSSTYVVSSDYDGLSRPQGVGYDIGAYEYPASEFSFSGVFPVNGSTTNNRNQPCNVTINESHGWNFNYTISENTSGSWVTQSYGNNMGNGSFSFVFTNASEGLTSYWWRVCVVNHSVWLNSTYHFTTGVLSPLVTTNASTGVEETNATLRGYLVDEGGEINSTIIYENYTTGYDIFGTQSIYTSHWSAQTFTPSITHEIQGTILRLYRQNTPTPKRVTAHIRETSDGGTKPTGIDLTSGYIGGSTLGITYPGAWYIINMTKYTLTAGVTYAIVVNYSEGAAYNLLYWLCDSTSPTYAGGNKALSSDGGTSWTASTSSDFMFSEFGYNDGATVNFQYGLTTSYGTDSNYQINSSGETFNANITGLSPGTLYHYRAIASNSNGTGYGSDMTLLTKPLAPSGLTVSTVHNTSMTLSWTKGSGANNTMIRQSTTSYPASITDGDLVYNGTLSACTNTSLTPGVLYYFSAWSYTAWSGLYKWSDAYDTVSELTRPNPPEDALITITAPTTATISWTKGAGANNTVVVYKASGMPTSVTDGTVTYNNTGTSYVQTITSGNVYYFKAWSYDEWGTFHHYSDYGTEFLNISGGGLMINCFDDDNGSNLTFDVTIVSYNGDPPTYTRTGCTNTHIVNVSQCPIGPGSTIKVSSADHNFRTRTIDIQPGIFALLEFYLPYTSTPMPDNESYLYKFTVNNEIGQPVENAYMEIKKQINMSNFSVIYTIYTDASGNVYPWLTPGQIYIIFINKTGYQDQYSNFIPTDQVFTQTFILKANSIIVQPPIISAEEIHFTVELSDLNTSMWANYTDDSGYTEWTTMVISCFNYSTFTWSTIGWDNTTNMSAWDTITTGRNSSNDYYFNLTYHNTYLGTVHMQIVIEADKNGLITPDEANDRFSWMGVIPFGATNFLMWLMFIAICYYADERDAGKFIIVFGVICIFVSSWVHFISPNALTIGGGIGLGILFIIIGFIMERGGKK